MFWKNMTALMTFTFFFSVVTISSEATSASETLCKRVRNISDPQHPEYVLKEFCDGDTLRCTNTLKGKGGVSQRVKSVCDDPRRCTNRVIAKACQDECSGKKTKVKLSAKDPFLHGAPLHQCSIQPAMFQTIHQSRSSSLAPTSPLTSPSP